MTDGTRAALFGAAAALVGAIIGAGASVIVAFHGTSSLAAQERDQFVREQRQRVYAAVIRHEQALEDLEKPCGDGTKLRKALQVLEDDTPAMEVTADEATYFDFGPKNLLGTHRTIVKECSQHHGTAEDLKLLEQNRKDLIQKMREDVQR